MSRPRSKLPHAARYPLTTWRVQDANREERPDLLPRRKAAVLRLGRKLVGRTLLLYSLPDEDTQRVLSDVLADQLEHSFTAVSCQLASEEDWLEEDLPSVVLEFLDEDGGLTQITFALQHLEDLTRKGATRDLGFNGFNQGIRWVLLPLGAAPEEVP